MSSFGSRKRRWWQVWLGLGLACGGLTAATPAQGLEIDPALAGRVHKAAGPLRLLVVLEQQPDFQALEAELAGLSPAERREHAIARLKGFAHRVQAPVLASLGAAARPRSLWLGNLITLEGGASVLSALSSVPTRGWVVEDVDRMVVDTVRRSTEIPHRPKTATNVVWSLDWLNVPAVWAQGFDGSGVIVGHVDTGVWMQHPDLANRLWTNPGEIAGNGIDDDGNGYVDDVHGYDFGDQDSDPSDDAYDFLSGGHGTHTAGTVCGDGTNGLGTGVAPGAKIIVCKAFLNELGTATFGTTSESVQYAAEMGAQIITMSVGAAGNLPKAQMQAERFIGDALRLVGVTLFNSSGNSHGALSPPFELSGTSRVPSPWSSVFSTPYSSRSGVISVGATAYQSDAIWSGSSQGPADWGGILPWDDYDLAAGNGLIKPDITAPGNGISSLLRPNGYSQTNWSGTSMACPHAAGVAALMLSKNPNLSPADIDRILETTAVDLGDPGKDNVFGAGRIDALAAVNAVPTVRRPSIAVEAATLVDPNGNGAIDPGEEFDLTLQLRNGNFAADATDVSALLFTSDPLIQVLAGRGEVASIPAGTAQSTPAGSYRLMADASAAQGHEFTLQVLVSAQNGYSEILDLQMSVGFPEIARHVTPSLELTVTDRGTLGWWNLDQLEGSGLRGSSGSNLLYIGGLWAGNGRHYMCNRDNIPTDPGEWVTTTMPNGRLQPSPVPLADEHRIAIFDDSGDLAPKGVRVTQHSLSWNDSFADDGVVLRYDLVNTGSELISNYHVGLYTDWDYEFPFYTRGGTDPSRAMAYMYEVYFAGEYVGVELLEPTSASNVAIIDNPTLLHPNLKISNQDKLSLMSGALGLANAPDDNDYSTIVAAGPYEFAPGDSIRVAFAVVHGTDLADLQTNADNLRQRYMDTPTAAPIATDHRLRLAQNTPNPFNPSTTIRFELERADHVRVQVFDLRGRLVRTLVGGWFEQGSHEVRWDGTDADGAAVASGVYRYRLESRQGSTSRTMTLVK